MRQSGSQDGPASQGEPWLPPINRQPTSSQPRDQPDQHADNHQSQTRLFWESLDIPPCFDEDWEEDLDEEAQPACSHRCSVCSWEGLLTAAARCIQQPQSAASSAVHALAEAEWKYAPSCVAGTRRLASLVLWDVIHPDSKFRALWDTFIIALLLYVAVVTPYVIGFDVQYDNKSFLGAMEMAINGCFFLDVFLNFRTALRKGEYPAAAGRRAEVIADRAVIARVYLTGWFALDFLAALPWKEMVRSLGAYMQLTKLPRLLQLTRLLRLVKLVKAVRASNMYRHVERRQGVAAPRVLLYALGAVLVLHLGACAWYFAALVESERLLDTWVERAGLQDASKMDLYITSLYFIVLTCTTVGYGDIYPVTSAERLLACFGILLGVVTLSYIVSTANTIISNSNKYEMSRAETQARVAEFLGSRPLPWSLATRVKRYYDTVSKLQFNNEVDRALVDGLPGSLRRDVLRDLHASLIRRVPLLRRCCCYCYPGGGGGGIGGGDGAQGGEELVLELAARLQLQAFRNGECVVMEGGWDTELYFVIKGRLAVRQYTHRCPTIVVATIPAKGTLHEDAYEQLAASAVATRGSVVASAGSKQIAVTAPGSGGVKSKGMGSFSNRGGMAGGGGTHLPPLLEQERQQQQQQQQQQRPCMSHAMQHDMAPASPFLEPRPMGRAPAALSTLDEILSETGLGSPNKDLESQLETAATHETKLEKEQLPAVAGASNAGFDESKPGADKPCAAEEQDYRRQHWQVRYNPKMPYRHLRVLMPGSYFGEYSCLTGCPRTASVVARQVSELLVLSRSDLVAAMSRWPHQLRTWKECEAYGNQERARLRRQLHLAGLKQVPQPGSAAAADAAAGGGGAAAAPPPPPEQPPGRGDESGEDAIHSEQRYQGFLRFVRSRES